jgi:hypothetical protein
MGATGNAGPLSFAPSAQSLSRKGPLKGAEDGTEDNLS